MYLLQWRALQGLQRTLATCMHCMRFSVSACTHAILGRLILIRSAFASYLSTTEHLSCVLHHPTMYVCYCAHVGVIGRKVSRSGYDVTPLTPEQKAAEAAKLNDFQR